MGKIERFEDLEAWKKARILTRDIYQITGQGNISKEFGLKDQLRRAAVSIMSNIAEGFERGGNKEFVQFLSIAKGSAGEVRSQLYVTLDAGFISQEVFESLYQDTTKIGQLIGGLMKYLSESKLKGIKYK